MDNPFDQFDEKPKSNPFDQFDDLTKKKQLPTIQSAKRLNVDPNIGMPDMPFIDRMLQGMRDPIDGAAQLLSKALPNSVSEGINSANNWLADKTGLVARLPEGGISQLVQDNEKKYQQQRGGNQGFDMARLTGNVFSPMNIAVASKIPVAATLPARMAIGASTGAGSAALNPVLSDNGDFWAEKLKQTGIGALAGGSIPLLGSALSKLISPNASTNTQLQALLDEGVKPTIGQTLGGTAARVEEKLQSVPILGDMISSARRKADDSFRVAAINRSLKPIGQELPKGVSGREAIAYTQQALGDKYDQILNKIGAITPDQTFNQNVASLTSAVNKMLIPAAEKEKFSQAVGNIAQSIDGNGVITSDIYKMLESSLGSDAKKLGMSSNIYEGKLSSAVKQLQVELRDMLKRQAGTQADDLQAVNSGWANFKRVQDAASKVGNESGNFSPAQFQTSVKTMGGKNAFANGSALSSDLGDAGKNILTGKIPNSGTADRLMLGGGALSSYMINPAIPLGLIGSGSMYTNPMQNLLRNMVATRPQAAQGISQAIEQYSPNIIPFTSGLLNQY